MLLALLACTPERDAVVLHVPPDLEPVFAAFVAPVGDDRLSLAATDTPADDARGGDAVHLAVEVDPAACDECYTLTVERGAFVVRGGAPLGVQYGAADALERLGYRFLHPDATRLADALLRPEPMEPVSGAPEQDRRGLHLHTLHPIEALPAVWEPGDANRAAAERIFDWVVKNRGNHVQWVGLDDIQRDAEVAQAWRDHTGPLLDAAHARGLTVGLGVQLFGVSNLQQAWDLLDEVGSAEAQAAEMDARLAVIADGLEWDVLNLSFGEFFGEDPETFIASANLAYDRMQAALPGVDVPATIHVGNYDDLRVEYQGEELLYYFLVDHADPGIRPWVHTVMYYNLFEDAGGAYLHDAFDEHRAFLVDHLQRGDPVGYFPESAYWIAFDNPVPLYLPVYQRSRWTDLASLRDLGVQLEDHVLFSSGWEWGYWQTDAATLRMGYRLPDTWDEPLRGFYAPWGEHGETLAAALAAVGDAQHQALIVDRLAPWMAGRDAIIDAGDAAGILSQPDRASIDEVLALDAAGRAAFAADVVDPLAAFADTAERQADAVAALPVDDPWFAEMTDGVRVTALRARFAADLWGAVLVAAEGGDPGPGLEAAAAGVELAQALVAARHAAPWYAGENDLGAANWPNPTIYDYGYLREADDLCFWRRELALARNTLQGATEAVPACVL